MKNKEIIDALSVFMVNSAGTTAQKMRLALQTSNQSFSFLAELLSQLGKETLSLNSIESASTTLAGKNAATRLEELFNLHGSDKSNVHNYHHLYGEILQKSSSVTRILEIGLGTNNVDTVSNMGINGRPGASLRAFRDFLPNAQIYGADIDRRILFNEERIETFFVDQTDLNSIRALADTLPPDFDLIIDDGLHAPTANLGSLILALPKLKSGGYLVVEDILDNHLPVWQVISMCLPPTYKMNFYQAKDGNIASIKRL